MATATSTTREARRRRILEGGSDRLAMITGRTPSQSSTSQDLDFSGGFSPPPPPPPLVLSESTTATTTTTTTQFSSSSSPSLIEEVNPSIYTLPKTDRGPDSNQIDALISGSRELLSHKAGTSDISSNAPASEVCARPEPSRPQPSSQVQRRSAARIHFRDLFTYHQVTSAVTATEQTRMFCSLAMAFLVVLSYMGFPIVSSSRVRSIIQFRPLFLVLVTNVTLILHHLISAKQRVVERACKDSGKSLAAADGYYGWAEEAGKLMEMVFMAQSIAGSLFMDCSVYAVIVVCGLSLA